MPIDVSEPQSPGWWMARLWKMLLADQKRLRLLEDYYTGRPPLPWGSENTRTAFYRFQQTSRSNFASLIVQAPCERCGVRAIRTAADSDESGDTEAWKVFTGNDLDVVFTDVVRMAFKFGRSYMAVGSPDTDGGISVITAEDPRQVITVQDPMRPRRSVAAFKIYHDDAAGLDVAILWLPGQKWVATRARKTAPGRPRNNGLLAQVEPPQVSFSPATFEMRPVEGEPGSEAFTDGLLSEQYATRDLPVVLFQNREGIGEFELHTDLLDRINHMILQRVVIATLQAFKQRALELEEPLPERDDDGQLIDWNDVFSADPGALWQLPKGAKIWESGQVELAGILQAVKDDVLHLAAVSRTPLSMFTPDAATQTAEGAQLQRKGLVFKVEEFLRGAGRSLARVMSLAFTFMGDEKRADVSQIAIDWLPVERYSLAEKGSAAAQAVTSLTWEQIQRHIWQMSPDEISIARKQRAQDALMAPLGPAAGAGTSRTALPAAPAPAAGGAGA